MDSEETVFHSEIQKGKLKESTIKPADLLFDRLTRTGDTYYCEVGLHDTIDSLQQVNEFTGLTEPVIQKSNLSMHMDEMIGDQIAKRALVRATDIPNGVVGSEGKLNMSVLGPTEFFSGTVGTGEVRWWLKNNNPSTDVEWNPLRKISAVGGMVAFRSGLVAIDECESEIHKGSENIEDGRISPMFPSKYGKLVSGIMSIVIGSDKDSETEVYCSGKKGEDFLLDLKNPVFLDAAETVFSEILSDDDMRFEPDGVAEEILPSGKQTPSTAGELVFDCEKILIRPRVSEGSDGASANIIYRATATYVPLDETKNMIRPFYGCVVLINIEDNRD